MKDQGYIVPKMDVMKTGCEVGWWIEMAQDRVQQRIFSDVILWVVLPRSLFVYLCITP